MVGHLRWFSRLITSVCRNWALYFTFLGGEIGAAGAMLGPGEAFFYFPLARHFPRHLVQGISSHPLGGTNVMSSSASHDAELLFSGASRFAVDRSNLGSFGCCFST